jgi:transcription antitermination factor NusG
VRVVNTPGVTVSWRAPTKPTPLSSARSKILAEEGRGEAQFRLGSREIWCDVAAVRRLQRATGEINLDRALKVLVNIFDRETPVELAFDQVAKV